jgi:polyhydroxyalkanoate synthesis regulator phasin
MAESSSRVLIEDVRASVQRIRDQGEKLVDRIRTDAKDLIANAPKVVSIDEARKRAEDAVKAVRELRGRRDEIVTDLIARAIKALGLAKTEQIDRLETRLTELERRIESVTKREQAA